MSSSSRLASWPSVACPNSCAAVNRWTGSGRCVVTMTPGSGLSIYAPRSPYEQPEHHRDVSVGPAYTEHVDSGPRPAQRRGRFVSNSLCSRSASRTAFRMASRRATVHPSFFCFFARRKSANRPSSSRSAGRESFRHLLRGQMFDVEVPNEMCYRPPRLGGNSRPGAYRGGQFLQLQSVDLALAGLYQGQGQTLRRPNSSPGLFLREAEVFPRLP